MTRTRISGLLGLLGLLPGAVHSQASRVDTIARATELRIPTAPALVLLGANPAAIATPGLVRDFKLDLLTGDGRADPDLALAARPVWTFFFRDVGRAEYAALHPAVRTLSTLVVSVGSAETNALRRLAWAAKLSLVRKDPLLDGAYAESVGATLDPGPRQMELATAFATARAQIVRERRRIQGSDLPEEERRAALDSLEAVSTRTTVEYRSAVEAVQEALTAELVALVEGYHRRHWNAPALDVGLGRLYHFSGSGADTLRLVDTGYGTWLSAASGFDTDRWLFSAMASYLDRGDVAGEVSVGVNARYGGPTFNFFVEALAREGGAGHRELAYGGEYRFAETLSLEFGLRTRHGRDLSLSDFRPVVKVSWSGSEHRLSDLLRTREAP